VRAISKGGADYRAYPRYIDQYAKFAEILRSIATPFVVMVPDDDITFPHAIDAALDYLLTYPEYVAAHGYVLRFRLHSHYFDIFDVDNYIPSIGEDNRLHRLSHLMRRYQPFIWAVFRTDAFAKALRRAAALKGTVFQELACMSISVLTGKVARLPIIYGMRGMEDSLTPPSDYDPFLWFLRDAESFFEKYDSYRNTVAKFIRYLDGGQLRRARVGPLMRGLRTLELANGQKLVQVLDLINATLLGRTLDTGVLNYHVQLALGRPKEPINPAVGPTDPQPGDLVHSSSFEGRRYLWRRAVIEAEPRNEINISAAEINIAERQLDAYVTDIAPTDSAEKR
jgi:glycosyltransferase domain-containing protein